MSEPLVHVVTGKQGRTNANKPAHELLVLRQNIAKDSDFLFGFQIEEIAEKANEMARAHAGHHFEPGYMAHHDGAYGISAIMIDNEYNVHKYTVPVYRPTSHGGHVVFRTGEVIQGALELTHSNVPAKEAGGMELGLFVGKFKDLDCLLITPDSLDSYGLFRALNLETKGDGSDTTTLVYLRMCDKLGLGRSPPHLSIGKFKFLFPGVELDTSQIKSKSKSKKRAAPEPIEDDDRVWDAIHTLLDNSFRKCVGPGADTANTQYRAKSFLFGLARRFLTAFNNRMGADMFDRVFESYTRLSEDVALDTMGSAQVIKSIVNMHVDDVVVKENIWNSLNQYTLKKTGHSGVF